MQFSHFFLTIILSTTFTFSIEIAPMQDNTDIKAITQELQINKTLKKYFTKKPKSLLKDISHKRFLRNFYWNNKYKALWIKEDQLDQKKYQQLFTYIEEDLTLNEKSSLFKRYKQLNNEINSTAKDFEQIRFEVKLTALYYDFLYHSIYGEIQWKKFSAKLSALKRKKISATWVRYSPKFSISKLLLKPNINSTIEEIEPKKFGYANLLQGLQKLQIIKDNGGWEKLPYFKSLKLETQSTIVPLLKERLIASNDYNKNCQNDEIIFNEEQNLSEEDKQLITQTIFGKCLDIAVKKFQKRHGLVVDGIVGGGTRRALNRTVTEKINTVLLNINRIKFLPRNESKRYIVINIPEFMLHYIEDKEVKQELKVIVGDRKHPSPIFSHEISFIVLNPYWKVPEGIVKKEIIPSIIKNRNYLRKQGLEIRRTWYEGSKRINPRHIYWADYMYGGLKFPYRIMQAPGPKNALGKIKFKFPNRFSVYLHDTPTKRLFKKTVRAFSHGCIRLSQPLSLLETIASFDEKIDLTKAQKILKSKKKKQLNMKSKLPIHLIYLTAGVNDEGDLEFRNDIYGYDKKQKIRVR